MRIRVSGASMTARHRQLNIVVQRVVVSEGNPFDPFGSTPTETKTPVWARREDTPVRNEIQAGSDQIFATNESYYYVRQMDPPWDIGDFLEDREGRRRRITGVSHVQQHGEIDGRLIQLLVEGYGGL